MPKTLNLLSRSAFVLVAVILLVSLALSSTQTVQAGHRGIVLQFGAVKGVVDEGIHFKLPFVQRIITMDVRVKKVHVQANAASRDLQDVVTEIAVNYHVQPESAAYLYKVAGMDYENTIIAPALQECIKAVTAGYSAENLITKRAEVSQDMKARMQAQVESYGLVIDAFNVINFEFSPEFTAAIEAKQAAEQLALKAERDLERVRIEAEQKIVQARAEAESLKIQKQEVTSELLRLREIEATLKAIEKWDGKMPSVTSGAVPFITLPK